ncbi:MAG: hypothetical protein CMA28_01205 [Euryarchaeota archaeon]|jgi:hypothetical protein|nr:hypothetical protein [Euryarchaeota archaeon]|tara:strand:- start:491 stop:1093 length:603 start_codon:yes stop_codon:yes gene_type:complete
MDNDPEENASGPRIDVRNLPESVSHLWEAMLRQNPSWDLAKWLDERASEELELLESHLGRERLRTEQRLHRIENLSKQMKRRRENSRLAHTKDPNQKNLFDVYSLSDNEKPKASGHETEPLIDLGSLSADDDPLLAYVSQKILMAIEDSNLLGEGLHFDDILRLLQSPVITSDDIDESIGWLLQKREIVEIERDVFIIDG